MAIFYFLLGMVFGMLFTCYIIGSALNKKFDTKEEFDEWFSRIKRGKV